jgi:hypothetical protein
MLANLVEAHGVEAQNEHLIPLGNKGHTFSNGYRQVTNHAYDLGHEWQPLSDASEEVLMVTQFDEKRWHLWEMAKANL